MHKREKTNNIFQNKAKFSAVRSFDSIAPIAKKRGQGPIAIAPATVLTFSFNTNSLFEIFNQLNTVAI